MSFMIANVQDETWKRMHNYKDGMMIFRNTWNFSAGLK